MASHDAAWKLLFSFPAMPHDLLAGFAPREWVEMLDLSTLQPWPADLVIHRLRKRHADRVWRVRRRDRSGFGLVTVEFQSRVDRTMAVRVLDYSTLLYQDLLRSQELRCAAGAKSDNEDRTDRRRAEPEPLPPVLPIVLYHGTVQWWAKEDVAGLCAPPTESLAPYQPEQRYFLLDLRRHPAPLPEGRNLFAILVRLVQSGCLEEEAAVVDELVEWLHEEVVPEDLARAFWTWMGYAHVPAWRRGMKWPVLRDWREAGTMLRESVNEWTTKWREEGRMLGRTEGRVEGQATVIRRQAARKFGPETADRLAERLAELPDPERLGEVSEWILEYEVGEELLARVARLCETAANGGGHS